MNESTQVQVKKVPWWEKVATQHATENSEKRCSCPGCLRARQEGFKPNL